MMEFIILAVIFWVVYSVFFKDKKNPPKNYINKEKDDLSVYKKWSTSHKIKSDPPVNIYENPIDDDLASLTISYGYEEAKSKNKTPGRWVNPGETIKIKDFTITKGNFYYGGKLKALDGYSSEAALVDDSLMFQKQIIEYEDDSLGYWPKFISLSSNARGAYLNWLASSRDNPSTPLGYVFIYFYGLERRILVDAKKKGSPVD
ncbi:MAG: TerB N-terminal domain-containing protein, partial [Mariprofundaceae bacterium]